MEREKIVCFDFDGVIAEYDGYKGKDVFGAPVFDTIDAIKELKKKDYLITIWTTRERTKALEEWLAFHEVPYDSLNDHAVKYKDTSNKPLYDCCIDDRAVYYNSKAENKPNTKELVEMIENRIGEHRNE